MDNPSILACLARSVSSQQILLNSCIWLAIFGAIFLEKPISQFQFSTQAYYISVVRGLCIATGQYSSLCVSAVVLFLGGFDHMEVDEQDREQVDRERKVEARERMRKKTK